MFDEPGEMKQAPRPMRFQNYLWIFCLALPFPLEAQPVNTNGEARPLALNDTIRMALEHNLEIRIENYNPQIFRLTLDGSYGAYDPVFNASGGHSYDSREGGVDPQGRELPPNQSRNDFINGGLTGILPSGMNYQLSLRLSHSLNTRSDSIETFSGNVGAVTLNQPLLRDFWIDQPRMTIRVNKKNLKISEFGVAFKVMDVTRRVQQAYYELIFARENVKVQETALGLANRLVAENKKKVEVGVLAPLDEKQAESQAAISRADLVRARADLSRAENVLKSLFTDDFGSWAGVSVIPSEELNPLPPTFSVVDSWQKGTTMRPDLAQQRLDLEKRDIVLKYNYNQLFPALDLFGTYGHNGFDPSSYGGVLRDFREGNSPSYQYGASFSVPLSNRSARNRYKQSKAEKQQAIDTLKKKEQDVLVEIDDAVKATRTSYERISATSEAAEYARIAYEAEQKRLDAGKSTPFVVLQLQRDLTTRRSESRHRRLPNL
ncbi:MAG: hypothetical protein DME26_16090 [Verrucomicrobia bacterium]|nr:MAG: hypothetical protein DME26_16090 [Verrucomicrobiota bacterium]